MYLLYLLLIFIKYNNDFSKNNLIKVTYIELLWFFCSETLRKYPPLVTLNRVVTKPYVIPKTNIKLNTGTKIIIPVHAIHHDAKYYSDPYDFNPDRFSEENVDNLHPNTYMPFGDGPRFCIGIKHLLLLLFKRYDSLF